MADIEKMRAEIEDMMALIEESKVEIERIKSHIEARRQFKFTRAELESWLYQIAFNNCGNSLGNACEEIISRLDGFERFVEDKRKEAENGKE